MLTDNQPMADPCQLKRVGGGLRPPKLPPHNLRSHITKMRLRAHFCDLISGKTELSPPPQPWLGDDDDEVAHLGNDIRNSICITAPLRG